MSKNKGNRLRFSKEEDEKLIHEVLYGHPALYNAKNKLYKDQNVKDNTWNEVSKNVQKSVEDCKKRWKRLKDVFWKKKKENKQGTGASAKSTSEWEHADALAFLETIERCRKTSNNVSVFISEGSFPGSPDRVEHESNILHENEETGTEMMQENYSEVTQFTTTSNLKRSNEALETGSQKKKKKTMTEKIFETLSKEREDRTKLIQKIESAMQISEEPEKRHPLQLFFSSMAETAMGFPPALAARAKMEVLKVITELELENCGARPSSTDAPLSINSVSSRAYSAPNSVEAALHYSDSTGYVVQISDEAQENENLPLYY